MSSCNCQYPTFELQVATRSHANTGAGTTAGESGVLLLIGDGLGKACLQSNLPNYG